VRHCISFDLECPVWSAIKGVKVYATPDLAMSTIYYTRTTKLKGQSQRENPQMISVQICYWSMRLDYWVISL